MPVIQAAGMVGFISIFNGLGPHFLGLGVGLHRPRPGLFPALFDSGIYFLRSAADPQLGFVRACLRVRGTLLRRRTRHDAFVHGRLFRIESHGRDLWRGLVRRESFGHSGPVADRQNSSKCRKLQSRTSARHVGHALCPDPTAPEPPTQESTHLAARFSSRTSRLSRRSANASWIKSKVFEPSRNGGPASN